MKWCAPVLFSIILLVSCSYGSDTDLKTGETEEHPTMVLKGATYVASIGEGEPITVTADRITIDEKTDTAVIEGFSFSQKDGDGNIDLYGNGGKAVVNTKNHDVTLSGEVVIHKKDDDFEIHASTMQWDNKEKTLKSGEDDIVDIRFDGTNTIKGRGFFGNMKTNTYEFGQMIQGAVYP